MQNSNCGYSTNGHSQNKTNSNAVVYPYTNPMLVHSAHTAIYHHPYGNGIACHQPQLFQQFSSNVYPTVPHIPNSNGSFSTENMNLYFNNNKKRLNSITKQCLSKRNSDVKHLCNCHKTQLIQKHMQHQYQPHFQPQMLYQPQMMQQTPVYHQPLQTLVHRHQPSPVSYVPSLPMNQMTCGGFYHETNQNINCNQPHFLRNSNVSSITNAGYHHLQTQTQPKSSTMQSITNGTVACVKIQPQESTNACESHGKRLLNNNTLPPLPTSKINGLKVKLDMSAMDNKSSLLPSKNISKQNESANDDEHKQMSSGKIDSTVREDKVFLDSRLRIMEKLMNNLKQNTMRDKIGENSDEDDSRSVSQVNDDEVCKGELSYKKKKNVNSVRFPPGLHLNGKPISFFSNDGKSQSKISQSKMASAKMMEEEKNEQITHLYEYVLRFKIGANENTKIQEDCSQMNDDILAVYGCFFDAHTYIYAQKKVCRTHEFESSIGRIVIEYIGSKSIESLQQTFPDEISQILQQINMNDNQNKHNAQTPENAESSSADKDCISDVLRDDVYFLSPPSSQSPSYLKEISQTSTISSSASSSTLLRPVPIGVDNNSSSAIIGNAPHIFYRTATDNESTPYYYHSYNIWEICYPYHSLKEHAFILSTRQTFDWNDWLSLFEKCPKIIACIPCEQRIEFLRNSNGMQTLQSEGIYKGWWSELRVAQFIVNEKFGCDFEGGFASENGRERLKFLQSLVLRHLPTFSRMLVIIPEYDSREDYKILHENSLTITKFADCSTMDDMNAFQLWLAFIAYIAVHSWPISNMCHNSQVLIDRTNFCMRLGNKWRIPLITLYNDLSPLINCESRDLFFSYPKIATDATSPINRFNVQRGFEIVFIKKNSNSSNSHRSMFVTSYRDLINALTDIQSDEILDFPHPLYNSGWFSFNTLGLFSTILETHLQGTWVGVNANRMRSHKNQKSKNGMTRNKYRHIFNAAKNTRRRSMHCMKMQQQKEKEYQLSGKYHQLGSLLSKQNFQRLIEFWRENKLHWTDLIIDQTFPHWNSSPMHSNNNHNHQNSRQTFDDSLTFNQSPRKIRRKARSKRNNSNQSSPTVSAYN